MSKNKQVEGASHVFVTEELRKRVQQYLQKVDECASWLNGCLAENIRDKRPGFTDHGIESTSVLTMEETITGQKQVTDGPRNVPDGVGKQTDMTSGKNPLAGEGSAAHGASVSVYLTQQFALERALHVAIECTTDAANLVIDALVMREPGGYADILRVLMEEDVVTREWFSAFEPAIKFRDRLVHDYASLQLAEVRDAAEQYAPLLPQYTAALRRYLDIA